MLHTVLSQHTHHLEVSQIASQAVTAAQVDLLEAAAMLQAISVNGGDGGGGGAVAAEQHQSVHQQAQADAAEQQAVEPRGLGASHRASGLDVREA